MVATTLLVVATGAETLVTKVLDGWLAVELADFVAPIAIMLSVSDPNAPKLRELLREAELGRLGSTTAGLLASGVLEVVAAT